MESPAETAERLWAEGWSTSRILSALGYPGYGDAFAAKIIAMVSENNCLTGTAVRTVLDGWS